VDGTARPQVVSAREEPALHALLTAYHRATGRTALINTSFNMHEEPIVAGATDALRAFARSGLPLMRLGPLLVEQRIAGSPARVRAASE
jgi:carbamoyltransferase